MMFRRQNGFTLIELIVVIVLLGIIAAMTTRFFGDTVQGYIDTSLRDSLTRTGRLATERINRELRNAVPNSIRVNGGCIEYLPMLASATYQDQALTYLATGTNSSPLPVNGVSAPSNLMDVFNLNFAPGAATYYIVVYPYGPDGSAGDPYRATNPGPLATFSGFDMATALPAGVSRIQTTAAHRFLRQSPIRRVFVTSDPVSFCLVGNRLVRYEGYGLQAAQSIPPPAANGQVLAEYIQSVDPEIPFVAPFSYTGSTLIRNAVVNLDFRFMRTDHLGNANWVRMYHEVQIRNVP
jgi:MSHA biogenesis protein MshO